MYLELTETMFIDLYRKNKDYTHLSDEALRAIFKFYLDAEKETKKSFSFDPVNCFGDWSHWNNFLEYCIAHGINYEKNKELLHEQCIWLNSGGFVVNSEVLNYAEK